MGNSQQLMSCASNSEKTCSSEWLRPLNETEIKLVQDSWKVLQMNMSGNGVVIFKKFFEMNPDMKRLFPKIVTINQDNKLECIIDEKMLQKHATTVMEALGAAVESLRDGYVLDNVLQALGQTHAKRDVKAVTLKRLWPALEYGLKTALSDSYSKETSDAWKKLYYYMCTRMKVGMTEAGSDTR